MVRESTAGRARAMRTRVAPIVIALVLARGLGAQTPPTPAPASVERPGPRVGDVAPDFALPGATRYGLLRDPVRLSDYRGRTVVLAFFSQARTKG